MVCGLRREGLENGFAMVCLSFLLKNLAPTINLFNT